MEGFGLLAPGRHLLRVFIRHGFTCIVHVFLLIEWVVVYRSHLVIDFTLVIFFGLEVAFTFILVVVLLVVWLLVFFILFVLVAVGLGLVGDGLG